MFEFEWDLNYSAVTTARVDHSLHSLLITSRGPPLLQTASSPGAPQQPATPSQTAAAAAAATSAQQPSGGAAAAAVPAAAASAAAPAASPAGAAAAAPAAAAGEAAGKPPAAAAGAQVQQQAAATQQQAAATQSAAAAATPAGLPSPRGNFLQQRGPPKRRGSTTLRRANTALHSDWVSYKGLAAGSSSSRALSAGGQPSVSSESWNFSEQEMPLFHSFERNCQQQRSLQGPTAAWWNCTQLQRLSPKTSSTGFPPTASEVPPTGSSRCCTCTDSSGFHGKPSDFVDVSSLAEGGQASSLRDFTVAVRAAVTGK